MNVLDLYPGFEAGEWFRSSSLQQAHGLVGNVVFLLQDLQGTGHSASGEEIVRGHLTAYDLYTGEVLNKFILIEVRQTTVLEWLTHLPLEERYCALYPNRFDRTQVAHTESCIEPA